MFELPEDGLNPEAAQFNSATMGAQTAAPVVDTGASHHLTGDRTLLFNFFPIKPISLQVATDTATAMITGIGSMLFPLEDGGEVVVPGVLYSE